MVSAVDILAKPVAGWSLADLADLCHAQAEESTTLELKQDLQTPQHAIGWRKSIAESKSPSLHKSESKDLAKEIVAFANSQGGRIIIGIEETATHPKRARQLAVPIPRMADVVERLRDAFAGQISPPIPGLRVLPIEAAAADGSGYVVIDVPRSLQAPHGVGIPPECYWRRDSSCQPMEMTDLHNAFWEARAGRERIDEELRDAHNRFHAFAAERVGFFFRFTGVSERVLSLPTLSFDMGRGHIAPHNEAAPHGGIANYPLSTLRDWRPTANGIELEHSIKYGIGEVKYNIWSIDQTGIVEVVMNIIPLLRDGDRVCSENPYHITATCAHLLYVCNYLNHFLAGTTPRWVLAGEFLSLDTRFVPRMEGLVYSSGKNANFSRGAAFRPITVDLTSATQSGFRLLEDRIWATFGLHCPDEARFTFRPPKPYSTDHPG